MGKILIISNNPLSNISNNGKTLVSIFETIDKSKVCQLYFDSSTPDYIECKTYFQINEKQIVNDLLRKGKCGREMSPSETFDFSLIKPNSRIRKSDFARLLRELIWKTKKWKNEKLLRWIKENNVDRVFFVAGDSIFSYDVCEYICDTLHIKPIVYITDDYVLGKYISPFSIFRHKLVKKKMTKTINKASKFVTISDFMSNEYEKAFGVKSVVLRNCSNCKMDNFQKSNLLDYSKKNIVYAGGLHYKRWKSIELLIEALDNFNKNNDTKYYLSVFSSQKIDEHVLSKICREGVSKFCGGIKKDALINVYNSCDMLLFVESFDKKAVNSTKYSFSTKIAEYLSLEKPIITVGPSECGSVDYLKKASFIIDKKEHSFSDLQNFLNNIKMQNELSKKAKKIYEEDFNLDSYNCLIKKILEGE